MEHKYLKDKMMPADVKQIPQNKLPLFCNEVRDELITIVSQTGGHIGPNLGVVELTVALYYVFEFPKDTLIWDIGHQTYIQKILTGRSKELKTIRENGKSPGYSNHDESEYDTVTSSHSGGALSLSLGLALSKKSQKDNTHSIAVVGDGGFVEGSNQEALNHLAISTCKTIVIINDNERAIEENFGGHHEYFKKRQLGTDLPETLFKSLNIDYDGPVDGHNILELVNKLNEIKLNATKPIILHIKTQKGKGLDEMANNSPVRIHWNHAFNPETYEKTEVSIFPGGKDNTEYVNNAIDKIFSADTNSVLITPGVRGNAGVSSIFSKYKDRCIDVSLAEQHAVTLGGGFALKGIKPIIAMESSFMIRAFGQIKHDICINNLPILIIAARSGHGFTDHITHNALQDITYLRSMPNLRIVYPVSCEDLESTIIDEYDNLNQPTIILFPKANKLEDPNSEIDVCSDFSFGKRDEATGLLLSVGPQNKNTQLLKSMLKEDGIDFDHIAIKHISPISSHLKNLLVQYNYIITLEEGVLDGGFGSIILENLNDVSSKTNVLRIGFNKQFIEHGTRDYIYKKYNIDAKSVCNTIKGKWKELWYENKILEM